jgi:hypothetical protein
LWESSVWVVNEAGFAEFRSLAARLYGWVSYSLPLLVPTVKLSSIYTCLLTSIAQVSVIVVIAVIVPDTKVVSSVTSGSKVMARAACTSHLTRNIRVGRLIVVAIILWTLLDNILLGLKDICTTSLVFSDVDILFVGRRGGNGVVLLLGSPVDASNTPLAILLAMNKSILHREYYIEIVASLRQAELVFGLP